MPLGLEEAVFNFIFKVFDLFEPFRPFSPHEQV